MTLFIAIDPCIHWNITEYEVRTGHRAAAGNQQSVINNRCSVKYRYCGRRRASKRNCRSEIAGKQGFVFSVVLECSSQRHYDRRLVVENSQAEPPGRDLLVNSLPATDLGEADRIFRIAFGPFLGFPNPMEFSGDADDIRNRRIADPSAAVGVAIGE